jgi:hypothetical protein
MDQDSDEPGRVASEYLQEHGGEAVIYIDGDIAKALGTHRWDDYRMLQRARLRLRRLELFEQISQQMRGGFGRPAEQVKLGKRLTA